MNNQNRNTKQIQLTKASTTQKTAPTPPNDNEEIADEIKQKYFVNPPYFDFIFAEEELGFNFCDFAKNHFYEFLRSIYLVDLIAMRKAYIMRNYVQVRFLAHKFKSPFGIIGGKEIRDKCEILHRSIDRGSSDIENEYLSVLECMGMFINKLMEFASKIKRELNPEITRQFMELNNKCNEMEDIRVKSRILPNYYPSAFESNILINSENITILESQHTSACCNTCNIF